jgi:hypothetical protein
VVPYPLYSPDLAPRDFFLFPRLKSTLKGKRFEDVAEIQLNTTRQLQAIPKHASGRIAGIAAYNLEGRTLKKVTSSRCFRFPTINSVPDIFDQPSYIPARAPSSHEHGARAGIYIYI